jgi:hypothetical protein
MLKQQISLNYLNGYLFVLFYLFIATNSINYFLILMSYNQETNGLMINSLYHIINSLKKYVHPVKCMS